MKRLNPINLFYEEYINQCDFIDDGDRGHSNYLPTGFKSLEYNVYDDNDIIAELSAY